MAVTGVVGKTIAYSIAFLDTNGAPMVVAPTTDVAPVWTNTIPTTETLAVSADGMSAVGTLVLAGADEVDVDVTVAGVSYHANVGVTAAAAAQVLGSVAINAVPAP